MRDLISEAALLQTLLDSRGWRFCFIGGLTVQHWGEPRMTRDLDLSLLTGFGGEEVFVDALLAAYAPRIADARQFALLRRVLLLRTESGIGIDISLAALPFEQEAVERAVLVEMLPGQHVRLCSPEDLIVMKMFAGRETDIRDVRSVLVRQGENIGWAYIERHLSDLACLSETPSLVEDLRRLRRQISVVRDNSMPS